MATSGPPRTRRAADPAPCRWARAFAEGVEDLSGYPTYIRAIFRAMQTYGLIVTDNGSDMYISGAMDSRWNNGELNPAFRSLSADDFEVIRLGWR